MQHNFTPPFALTTSRRGILALAAGGVLSTAVRLLVSGSRETSPLRSALPPARLNDFMTGTTFRIDGGATPTV